MTFSDLLLENIFLQEDSIGKRSAKVVIYAGRFQPFHMGHYQAYKSLVSIFGHEDVYIATSNVTNLTNSPLTFKDKKEFITQMFDVPSSQVVQVKNPYAPTEILSKYDSNSSIYVAAVSQKDADRLTHGQYFEPFNKKANTSYLNKGYTYVYPMSPFQLNGQDISASMIRKILMSDKSDQVKRSFFKKIYPKYNDQLYQSLIDNLNSTRESINDKLMNEGGAAGHMLHPFEDKDITFNELMLMIDQALSGKIELAQEKLDGQNLMVSWKNGQLILARNKGDLKNFGENALTVDTIKQKFSGRGNLETAFSEAAIDLSTAIKSLSDQDKLDIFQEGKRFINLEILFPDTENVIPYGASVIQFHHIKEYDQEGNEISQDHDGINVLNQKLIQAKSNVQKTYSIKTAEPARFKELLNFDKVSDKYKNELLSVITSVKLSPDKTLGKYIDVKWNQYINTFIQNSNVQLNSSTKAALLARWSRNIKSVRLDTLISTVDNSLFTSFIKNTESNLQNLTKQFIEPIESVILAAGAQVLKNIDNLLTINPDSATKKIQDALRDTISKIQSSEDQKSKDMLKLQLKRLQVTGGMNAILPTEGIVFKFNNKLYKLTGAFAPINRILGALRY